MALSAEELARYRAEYERYAEAMGDIVDEPSPLETVAETLGFIVESARADGSDEEDAVELFVHLADLDRASIREAAKVLRPLGYVAVADRLKVLARRARKAEPRSSCLERARVRRVTRH